MKLSKRNEYIVLVSVIVLGYGLLTAFVWNQFGDWRTQKGQEYFQKAKSSSRDVDKMLYFEQAAILQPTEETLLAAGITALNMGDNGLAGKYLSRVRTAEGYFQLATAYYNLSKYDLSATYFQKSLDKKETSAAYLGMGKSFLKLGEVEKASTALTKSDDPDKLEELLQSRLGNPGESAVAAYNTLNALGYPQSAKYVLKKAAENNEVTRDGLITLANSHIEAGEYQTAYDLLTRARAIDAYYPQIYKHLILVSEKLGKIEEAKQYQNYYNSITF